MASSNAVSLIVKIVTDASGANKDIDKAASGYEKFGAGVKKAAPAALATIGAITAIGIAAVNSASDTQQAMGALDSVFGKNADVVKGWADQAATSVGLSASKYGELASIIGAQLNNLGVDSKSALKGTKDLITIGADLAATYGGTTADAVGALSAALRGEADPAERYGLALSQTRVQAELAKKGLSGLTGEAATAAKAQTILEMATAQAGGAMGQFGRETDTAAGSTQIASAEFENAKSALGEALLPVVVAVMGAFAGLAKWIGENTTLVGIIVGVIGGLAAVILILNVAMTAATVVTWAMNAAWLASPITWIIIAVIALVAAFVILWNKCEGFRNFFIGMWAGIVAAAKAAWSGITTATQASITFIINIVRSIQAIIAAVWTSILNAGKTAWEALKNVVMSVVNAILHPIQALESAFRAVVSAVQAVIGWISKIKIPNLGGLKIGGQAAPAGVAVGVGGRLGLAPSFRAATGGFSAAPAGGVSITVYGGLDSADTIARRIEGIMTARSRRTSGVDLTRRTVG
jgi:hypothetical protein